MKNQKISTILFSMLVLLLSCAESQSTELLKPKPVKKIKVSQDTLTTFKTYCAACHGQNAAGGVGVNLTDTKSAYAVDGVLSKAKIKETIENGTPNNMPQWKGVISPEKIEALVDYVDSLWGLNLPSNEMPAVWKGQDFTKPTGSLNKPYILRTYMPTMGVKEEVFKHHGRGLPLIQFNGIMPLNRMVNPLEAVPTAFVVNFGDDLSYCFDITEGRLLYAWKGEFLDMRHYWGGGSGGDRQSFGYLPKVLGSLFYKAEGQHVFASVLKSKAPQFKGYRKHVNGPTLIYDYGGAEVHLCIRPFKGKMNCHYQVKGWDQGLTLKFPLSLVNAKRVSCDKGFWKGNDLQLDKDATQSFTVSYSMEALK